MLWSNFWLPICRVLAKRLNNLTKILLKLFWRTGRNERLNWSNKVWSSRIQKRFHFRYNWIDKRRPTEGGHLEFLGGCQLYEILWRKSKANCGNTTKQNSCSYYNFGKYDALENLDAFIFFTLRTHFDPTVYDSLVSHKEKIKVPYIIWIFYRGTSKQFM